MKRGKKGYFSGMDLEEPECLRAVSSDISASEIASMRMLSK